MNVDQLIVGLLLCSLAIGFATLAVAAWRKF